ncbi:MAG: histone deacetylase family protein [candidate division KSB1 bacterium]|nr:histone deacetylase family protein [candidate division KSB1 bacterium]
MKMIEKYNDDLHNPQWKFQLGPETYETKDTPQRVNTIKHHLLNDNAFERVTAKPYPERLIARMHPYHDFIKKTSESITRAGEEIYPDLFPGEGAHLRQRLDNPLWGGIWCTDAVTPIMKKTFEVARASAECALLGADILLEASERAVYALCRPSGHHAGPRVFGGYCYFNNAAVAAEYLSQHGSVAVLDIDYHHGNGTQEFFYDRKFIFTASIHADTEVEYPYYWGYAQETGAGQGKQTNLNLPLPLKSDSHAYMQKVQTAVKAINQFAPDFFIISAGFDTHKSDPIGGFTLETSDYTEIGGMLSDLSIPTLICQEGGYNINVLGECVYNFLKPFC